MMTGGSNRISISSSIINMKWLSSMETFVHTSFRSCFKLYLPVNAAICKLVRKLLSGSLINSSQQPSPISNMK